MDGVGGTRGARRRGAVLLVLALLALGLLSGCARVRAALAVQPNDTVTGEVVLATPPKGPDDHGPAVTLPEDLQGKVDVSSYTQDNYTGSVLRFSGLTFEQITELTDAAGGPAHPVQIQLRRAGGRVLVSGRVDLTTVSVDRADFQLKVSFPGSVVESNGDVDEGTVAWNFVAGQVGEFHAVAAYADPDAPSVLNWTLLLVLLVGVVCAVVVRTAKRTSNPPITPPPSR